MIDKLHHVQLRVAPEKEATSILFYKNVLGLTQIPKTYNDPKKSGGAWFILNDGREVHISLEDANIDNSSTKRHICFEVKDLIAAKKQLEDQGVVIISEEQPIKGWSRIFFRDPAGNRLEFAQKKE